MPESWNSGADERAPRGASVPVPGDAVRTVLRSALASLGYGQITFNNDDSVTAHRGLRDDGFFQQTSQFLARVAWSPAPGGSTALEWEVREAGKDNRRRNARLEAELGPALAIAVATWRRSGASAAADTPEHDPIRWPGEAPPDRYYTGTVRDYSACALPDDVADMADGTLPLGRLHHGYGEPGPDAPRLFVGRSSTGAPLEHNGILICAPQNSGKTELLLRWASAGAQARRGYATFVIDVKGNMAAKLAARGLRGETYRFSTDPADGLSDRINFLAGHDGLDAESTEELQQLAAALLPSRGFSGVGGEQESFYVHRLIWLKAMLQVLKLHWAYRPDRYVDPEGNPRDNDLCDLYRLAADESALLEVIEETRAAEAVKEAEGASMPHTRITYWARELALMLRPEDLPEGKREEKDSYRSFTAGIVAALEPFAPHGTLSRRVRSFGTGRLFGIEETLSRPGPVTIILVARTEDRDRSAAVMALAIKRLLPFLLKRKTQPAEETGPVMLLLDETARIRDFDTAEFFTFAREARATCVVAYQSLDQVRPKDTIETLLENVGLQIYLGSLSGNTARQFMALVPKRDRPRFTRQVTRSQTDTSETTIMTWVNDECLTAFELHELPAGRWPALVYVNDRPRKPPVLVSLAEPADEPPPPSRPVRRIAVAPPPPDGAVVRVVRGGGHG